MNDINKRIELDLRKWFKAMIDRFPWLSFKFEFSNRKKRYIVSFSPIEKIEQNEEFCLESLNFSEQMENKYPDNTPLFCDDEDLFKLSENAELISLKVSFSDIIIAKQNNENMLFNYKDEFYLDNSFQHLCA